MKISFIHMQILVHLHVNKTNFHKKGFTPGLAETKGNSEYRDWERRTGEFFRLLTCLTYLLFWWFWLYSVYFRPLGIYTKLDCYYAHDCPHAYHTRLLTRDRSMTFTTLSRHHVRFLHLHANLVYRRWCSLSSKASTTWTSHAFQSIIK